MTATNTPDQEASSGVSKAPTDTTAWGILKFVILFFKIDPSVLTESIILRYL
jgi:hypothetical protein